MVHQYVLLTPLVTGLRSGVSSLGETTRWVLDDDEAGVLPVSARHVIFSPTCAHIAC